VQRRSTAGFTLIELIIVIAIIGIVAAVVFVAVDPARRIAAAREGQRAHNTDQLKAALNTYFADTRQLPTGVTSGGSAQRICRTGITDSTCVNLDSALAGYMKKMPVDPAETNALWTGYAVFARAAGLDVVCNYTTVSSPEDAIANWRFDESAGTVAADSSGNGYHGTLLNGPTVATGRVGNGLAFDGVDDMVQASANSAFNLGTGDFSVAFWVKTSDLTGYGSMFSLDDNLTGLGIILYRNAGDGVLRTWIGNSVRVGTVGIANGAWHHVAITRSAGTVTDYIDGVSDGTHAAAGSVSANQTVKIGWAYDGTYNFIGTMDEVRLYNRALNATEVQALAAGR
jgi:sialidase-1